MVWEHFYSSATTPSPWLRAQLPTGSKWSLISKALVNLASPGQCAPSAAESTRGLTQASQSFPQSWLYPDSQFAHLAEQRHTNLSNNIALSLRKLTAFLLSDKSAACVVVDVQMLLTSRRHSREQLAHSLDCLSAHPRGNGEVSWYESTASLQFGKSPACGVLDVDVPSIPEPDSSSIAVPGERCESAGTAHELWTRYPWLSIAGLPWFVCLIFEGVGEIGSWRLLHKRIRGRCPERRSGNPVGLAHSHSMRHRANRTVAKVYSTNPPEVEQRAGQFVGASRTESSRAETNRLRSTSCFKVEVQ
jgi:hypothetical protein